MNTRLEPPTSVALYARVSSERQDVDLSVAGQLRALRDYAKSNGYSVAREYVDEAESGRIADRPQFRRMIDDGSKANSPFQVILVWKFSRFTRKREHAVAFKSMLRRKGIRVVSITEHADDTPTGKLMETIIESVDEFYSENLCVRAFFVVCYYLFELSTQHSTASLDVTLSIPSTNTLCSETVLTVPSRMDTNLWLVSDGSSTEISSPGLISCPTSQNSNS